MCRLFGMLAAEPVAARFWLLGAADSVVDQSYRNPDGTGLAHYVGPKPVVEKHPIAAHEDREFATDAHDARSHLFVAHVRHATRGEPRPENTQPFSRGNRVFAHDGTIDGLEEFTGLWACSSAIPTPSGTTPSCTTTSGRPGRRSPASGRP